jgi:hypothetical protein
LPDHQAQHKRTEKCLNGLEDILLSDQPASGYHDPAIAIMPGSVTAYTINPWNNTQANRPRKDEKNSLVDGASCPISNITSTPEHHNGGKRDPTTPDMNKNDPSVHQRQKKPHCGVKFDTSAKEKKALCMFYLRNPSINRADIFSRDMTEKLCANFICKGKECNNTNCDFDHTTKALELKRKTIIVIANHFIKKHMVWFNEYHFMRMPNITDGSKSFLVTQKVLPVRQLDLSDSYIAT